MLEKESKKRPAPADATLLQLMESSPLREQDTVIVPRGRRAREARAERSSSANRTVWIRRTPGEREPLPVRTQYWLWGAGAVLLVAVGWFSFSAVRTAYQARPVVARVHPSHPVIAAAPATAPATPPAPGAPISISIKSNPSGATVLDLDGEKKLGVTPFSASMDAGDKDLWLVLRKDGFSERVVRVNLRRSSEWSERLAPESTTPHKPAARQTVEEIKKKYDSGARSNRADSSKPRIVD